MRRKIRKLLAATLIVGTLTFAPEICGVENFPVARAEVKLYTAMGVDYGNEYESQDIVKLRARDKAIKNATKQAGVYLKTYSRSINNELTDDEILAITSNSYEVVGEVRYNRTVKQVTDQITLIVWEATVDVNVDDGEITKWAKRDDRDRSTLISQTRESQSAAEENDRKVEDLRRRSQNVSDDAGRAQLQAEFKQADNEFLSNQKVEEGNRAAYKGDIEEAAKFYSEAIELNSNNPKAYLSRGSAYATTAHALRTKLEDTRFFHRVRSLGDNAETYQKLGFEDFAKAIELKPDFWEAYHVRGFHYYMLKDYPAALADFNKAIELAPNESQNYTVRAMYWRFVAKDDSRALADYNKAIELNPQNASAYSSRAGLYKGQGNYLSAIEDLTRAIELETRENSMIHQYTSRAECYKKLKAYDRVIADYTKAIELDKEERFSALTYYKRAEVYQETKNFSAAIADYTRAIELLPNEKSTKILLPWAYSKRAQCYKAVGDNAKAQADMQKYNELK